MLYNRPLDWYEPEEDYESNPKIEELEQTIDCARDWFIDLTDILYGKKIFDIDQLENSLDELGSYLGYKIPITNLKITKT